MFEWSDEELAIRDAVRSFVDKEVRPLQDDLEHGDLPPYDVIRKFYAAFGMEQMAGEAFDKAIARAESGEQSSGDAMSALDPAMGVIVSSEFCRVSMGIPAAIGVSVGLAGGTINARGSVEQRKRWGPRPDDIRHGRRLGDHRAGRRLRRVRWDAHHGAP